MYSKHKVLRKRTSPLSYIFDRTNVTHRTRSYTRALFYYTFYLFILLFSLFFIVIMGNRTVCQYLYIYLYMCMHVCMNIVYTLKT